MSKQKVNNVHNLNDVFFQNLISPQKPVVEKIYTWKTDIFRHDFAQSVNIGNTSLLGLSESVIKDY